MKVKDFKNLVDKLEKNTLAIDFDGVIHNHHLGFHDGTVYGDPIPGALNAIKELSKKYSIIITTCKANPKRPLIEGKTGCDLIWEWLDKYGIKNNITDIFSIIFIFLSIKSLNSFLIVIPIMTGKVTTKAIFKDIPVIEILFDTFAPKISADVITINGTEIILIRLVTAVKEIDNATSPFANLVNIFDVTPPGAAAIIIKPTAIGKRSSNIIAIVKAINGKIINCENNPTKKSLGVFNILVKSFVDRPRPRPNIIKANTIGAILVTIYIILF